MTEPRHADPLPLGGGDGLPYSRGLMARALSAAGVPVERAYELATRIEVDLAERDARSTDLDRVEELACEVLGFEEGSDVVRRLRRYAALNALDLPILLFVGGSTGRRRRSKRTTGRPSASAAAATRSSIVSTTSLTSAR